MPDTRFCLLSVVFIAIITLRRKGCKRAAEVGIRRGGSEKRGRQDSLRASCSLPRGRCQAEKRRPGEGALSFFCWRPFAGTPACSWGVREQRGDKIGCAHLVRSRGGATKPRNRALARALYRFFAGAHLQACLHGRQQKNDCDCRHNRFSAWRRGQDSNLR